MNLLQVPQQLLRPRTIISFTLTLIVFDGLTIRLLGQSQARTQLL